MALTVKVSNTSMRSVCLSPKSAVLTAGASVGTNNLSSCLGVIIHNSVGRFGVVANIYVPRHEESSLSNIEGAFSIIADSIGEKYSADERLSITLVGMGGVKSVSYECQLTAMIYEHFCRFGLHRNDIMDLRNGDSRNNIGSSIAPDRGVFTACNYDPGSETLWMIPAQNPVQPLKTLPDDVKQFSIQS